MAFQLVIILSTTEFGPPSVKEKKGDYKILERS